MARRKLIRFAENLVNKNVIDPAKPIYKEIKGKWNEFFGNNNPIVLELACGRGEYSVGLGEIYRDKNFIGIDVKGDRIWKGSTAAIAKGLDNVVFLRTEIHALENFFEKDEVSEIWIVFPDPRPKTVDMRRRLTNPRYLEIYKKILKANGLVRLKTDNPGLFEYTMGVLKTEKIKDLEFTTDLYNSPLNAEHHGIKTKYEGIFTEKGFTINYLKFRFAE